MHTFISTQIHAVHTPNTASPDTELEHPDLGRGIAETVEETQHRKRPNPENSITTSY